MSNQGGYSKVLENFRIEIVYAPVLANSVKNLSCLGHCAYGFYRQFCYT